MSKIDLPSYFRESLDTFNNNRSEVHEGPDKLIRPEEPSVFRSAFFDLKTKRLILNDDQHDRMSGDAKPPNRFNQYPPGKTPEELLHDINEKLRLNAVRRERVLQNIVSKSRRFIEKVQKVRDRLTKRERETCQNTISTLHSKRQAAEKVRERLLQYKMDRIRKRLEHVTIVREKKKTNSNTSKNTTPQSTSPRPKESEV